MDSGTDFQVEMFRGFSCIRRVQLFIESRLRSVYGHSVYSHLPSESPDLTGSMTSSRELPNPEWSFTPVPPVGFGSLKY